MRFSPYDMHVERLAASRRPDTEEVGVVGHLDLALLARDVDADGQPLPVGVVRGQGRVLRFLQVFLEEEAQGGVRQGEEQVVVGIEGVGVAGEAVGEQLQLVVGRARGHDAASVQLGLQVGSDRGDLVRRAAHQDVEVGVDQQGAVHGKFFQDLLDVGLGYPVARVGHGAVPFGLGLQFAEKLPLAGYLHHLVVHHAIRMGNIGQEREQVGGDAVAVYVGLRVGPDA